MEQAVMTTMMNGKTFRIVAALMHDKLTQIFAQIGWFVGVLSFRVGHRLASGAKLI